MNSLYCPTVVSCYRVKDRRIGHFYNTTNVNITKIYRGSKLHQMPAESTAKRNKLLPSSPWKHMRGVEIQLHTFLTSALAEGEVNSTPQPFHPTQKQYRVTV